MNPGVARSRRQTAGFTLLEVLMALAIFAMAAIVLASSYINILMAYDFAAKETVSNADLTFARSLVLEEPDREKVERGGDFDSAEGGRVTWKAEIASTNTADVFTVTFTCEVAEGTQGQPQKTVETFTVLRPTWSVDEGERSKLKEDARTRILQMQGKVRT